MISTNSKKLLFAGKKEDLLDYHLPKNLKQAIDDTLDPYSDYFTSIYQNEYSFNLYIIEKNNAEDLNTCHFFSTDIFSSSADNYSYQSISLSDIKYFHQLIKNLYKG